MSRVFAFAIASLGISLALISWMAVGCSNGELEPLEETGDSSAMPRRDTGPVDPTEGGPVVDSAPNLPASCEKYCDLVMSNCTGENAQYGARDDCLAFCTQLPLVQPTREVEEKAAPSVACRQYWADSPAHTNPNAYCLSAGPFGGNVCGDRCTTFCDVSLVACSLDGGSAPYGTQPECESACASFSYRDAGTDGGGEGPSGPKLGDTLNCRLYHLRAATKNAALCGRIHPDGGICAQE
jgi:hypothetical protein